MRPLRSMQRITAFSVSVEWTNRSSMGGVDMRQFYLRTRGRAGLPATIASAGTSRTTTDPAPTTARAPMRTP